MKKRRSHVHEVESVLMNVHLYWRLVVLFFFLRTTLSQPASALREKGKSKKQKVQCSPRTFIEHEIQLLNEKIEEKTLEMPYSIHEGSKEAHPLAPLRVLAAPNCTYFWLKYGDEELLSIKICFHVCF